MEYIGTKCTKLPCSWTGRWCASYREDLKYLRKCGKPQRFNERKEDPITLLDVLKEQKASKYSGTLPDNHVKFEQIRLFQVCNGRVGRWIMY